MDGEFGVGRYTLLHFEWISNEVLLYSTGKSIICNNLYAIWENNLKRSGYMGVPIAVQQ